MEVQLSKEFRSSQLDLMLHLAQDNKMLILAAGFQTFHASFRHSRGDYGKVILRGSRVTDVVMAWEGQLLIRLEEDCGRLLNSAGRCALQDAILPFWPEFVANADVLFGNPNSVVWPKIICSRVHFS